MVIVKPTLKYSNNQLRFHLHSSMVIVKQQNKIAFDTVISYLHSSMVIVKLIVYVTINYNKI